MWKRKVIVRNVSGTNLHSSHDAYHLYFQKSHGVDVTFISVSSLLLLPPSKQDSEKLKSSKGWNKDFYQVRMILRLYSPYYRLTLKYNVLHCTYPSCLCAPFGSLHPIGTNFSAFKSFQLKVLSEEISYSGFLDAPFSLIFLAEVSEVRLKHLYVSSNKPFISFDLSIRPSWQALRIHSAIPLTL